MKNAIAFEIRQRMKSSHQRCILVSAVQRDV